jgi:maltose O-acetyltransferase
MPRRVVEKVLARIRRDQDPAKLVAGGLNLGRGVVFGRATYIDTSGLDLISIGDETVISADVMILSHDNATKLHLDYSVQAPVTIGKRVYLGAHSIVLPGVEIGDGAIVGAGSVVRRDVPPGTIVAGNPAEVVVDVESYVARHRKWQGDGSRTAYIP